MKIFISHPIKDEKLAMELKSVLESSDEIEIAHIAQRERNFDLEISHKIIKQINESDYLIAIITDNSYESASVNQELGYAQGIDLSKIPLIEKTAKAGFLIYGKDKIEFVRNNFQNKCKEILEYILANPKQSSKNSSQQETTSLQPILSLQKQITNKMPNVSSAFRRIVIIPSSRFVPKPFSNDVISFLKRGPDMFKTSRSVLQQNEVHLIGNKQVSDHVRYGIINDQGKIALDEVLHYDKVVEISRELIYLLLTLIFAKEFYKKIGFSGTLAIRYNHHRVENFQFGPSPDSSHDIMDSYTVQKSDVEIKRSVELDFDVIELANSIMIEFGRACDWVATEQYFVPYLKVMVQSYFQGRV